MTKDRLEELAIFGGAPAFAETLHVGRPNVGDRASLLARINDLLDRRWLTNDGPFVQEFERKVAALVGVKHCVAMCNATVALEIAIRALGMTGEVIIPSFTFVATAHALQWQEITPVFCDIDPATHTIDPRQIERMITPRTSGVIAVHLWGQTCDTESIEEICRRRDLRLIYDAAHAFGNTRGGRMVGGFGDVEVFSFHATKFFNTFEGGAVTTNDDELAAKIRLMKNFGFAGYDKVIYIGTNGKMSEVAAAMGLTSLESMDDFIAVNRRNYEVYKRETRDIPGVQLMPYDAAERCNYQYIVFEVDRARTSISRNDLIKILWAENVIARRYFYPGCHRMEPYRSYYPHAGLMLETTEEVCERVLLLPNGTAVGENEIRDICQVLRLAVGHGAEVSARLASAPEPQAAKAK
ncbi:MAG TPA: DegT/DnrJ/EryC1/StrS family aminotransferase [Pyrinomonadaceae bacterium]|nr:DegT/DnrJ/EryC1/StrS family aminotransferase [Pyrinomonadaceae bacterium]